MVTMRTSTLPDFPQYRQAKIPFMYTVNWNSYYLDKTLQLRYATAVGQQTRQRYSTISPVAIPMRKARC